MNEKIQVGCGLNSHATANTRGSLFEYHQCIKRDKAGPFFGIKWVPFMVLKTTAGRPATVYYLTPIGMKHIADTLDLPVPTQPGARSNQFLEHSLDCTEVLLAALELQRVEQAITVLDLIHERTLKASPMQVATHRYVVPDGYLRLRATAPYGVGDDLGLVLEIDRNSEGRERYLQKIEAYKLMSADAFGGLSGITIAVVVTAGGADRRNTLIEWSKEALHNHAVKNLFVFSAPDTISPNLYLSSSFLTVDNLPCALVEKVAKNGENALLLW